MKREYLQKGLCLSHGVICLLAWLHLMEIPHVQHVQHLNVSWQTRTALYAKVDVQNWQNCNVDWNIERLFLPSRDVTSKTELQNTNCNQHSSTSAKISLLTAVLQFPLSQTFPCLKLLMTMSLTNVFKWPTVNSYLSYVLELCDFNWMMSMDSQSRSCYEMYTTPQTSHIIYCPLMPCMNSIVCPHIFHETLSSRHVTECVYPSIAMANNISSVHSIQDLPLLYL